MSLLPVADALAMMRASARPIEDTETVLLHQAANRVMAADLVAARDQPPFPASAMDGYAVRAADLPGELRMIGESAAGQRFEGVIGPSECCRIFTGAVVPEGADAVLIQENATTEGRAVRSSSTLASGTYIRPAGLDYRVGETLLPRGRRLDPATLALHASVGLAKLSVARRPKVAVIMSGDELTPAGDALKPDAIYASNGYAVAAIVEHAGGQVLDHGIVPDDEDAIGRTLDRTDAEGTDIVVTLGGASVGDHDLIRPALEAHGVAMQFLKLAMRPGKPVMFGTRGRRLFLGLPGNPVSSIVGAHVLLVPIIQALLGLPTIPTREALPLAVAVPPNGDREHYMRARLTEGGVEPFENQDSSLLRILALADVLVVRAANDPARKAGETVQIMRL